MDTKYSGFEYVEYSYTELNEKDINLIESAQHAASNAYAPYSEFKVGASCRLENQLIISGNNQENAAYPSGLCAERVALFFAGANYPDVPVIEIAIVALNKNNKPLDKPITPCGACRQVIAETSTRYHKNIRLLLAGSNSVLVIENANQLLPLMFDVSFLK